MARNGSSENSTAEKDSIITTMLFARAATSSSLEPRKFALTRCRTRRNIKHKADEAYEMETARQIPLPNAGLIWNSCDVKVFPCGEMAFIHNEEVTGAYRGGFDG